MNRWVAEHVFWPATEQLLRRDTMRRLRDLRQSSQWSPARLHQLQSLKLRRLLKSAVAHNPFHAERIRWAGIDADDPALSLDILQQLPTLSRDDIRDHLEQMTWLNCPRGGARLYNTGGSSGEPLKFYFDRFRQAADWAARWRARERWGIRPGAPELLLWGAPVELQINDRLRQWRDALLNQHMLNAFDMSERTMQTYVEHLRRRRPACVYGYASSLALLARYAFEQGISPGDLGSDRLKAIFVTGEVLLAPDRDVIESAFGAPVAIEYGCRDGGLIAFQCPGGRLHVPQENVIVELLDADARPVQPGQIGEVVVTHLETLAMPVIRYRTGDLARAWVDTEKHADHQNAEHANACSCGMAHAALAEVRGRLTDQIVCRKGDQTRRMHALALIYVLRDADGIRQFRITQKSIDLLDVDVVPDAHFTPDIERTVQSGLRERMGDHVTIRIHRRKQIPPTPSGKHACVISHVDN